MIVRVIPKRSATSDIQRLAKYLTAEKPGAPDRLIATWAAGTGSDDELDLAVKELALKQARNTRSKLDKTLHLLVSFHPNERPVTQNEFRVIEGRLLAALKLTDHGRIVAIHGDTAHQHMHVAINLVDERGRMASMSFSQMKLATEREKIREDFKFLALPGQAKDSAAVAIDARRIDVQGLDSFASWVKENGLPRALAALAGKDSSWESLHRALATVDLEIRPHGAGLSISHKSQKLFVRASAVQRGLSKSALEKKLGAYQAPSAGERFPAPELSYKKASSVALFGEFQKRRVQVREDRAQHREVLKGDLGEQRRGLSARAKAARAHIWSLGLGSVKTRQYLALTELNLAKDRQVLANSFDRKFREVASLMALQTWPEFLQEKANSGDSEAVRLLRKRAPDVDVSMYNQVVQSKDVPLPSLIGGLEFKVSQSGQVVYSAGNEQFKDAGRSLIFQISASDDIIKAGLQLAASKYGNSLKIRGTKEFREQCERVAKSLRIRIAGRASEGR